VKYQPGFYKIAWFFDWLFEMTYLFGGSLLVYRSKTFASTRTTIFFLLMVHYFKMNSYSKTNRAYYTEAQNASPASKPATQKWEEDAPTL